MKNKIFFILLTGLLILSSCGSKEAKKENKELTRGTIQDNVYSSEYNGLKFTAPENWGYADDDYMAKLMQIGADSLSESGLKVTKELLELQAIYDMLAINSVDDSKVIVMYENLSVSNSKDISEEDFLKATMKILKETSNYNDAKDLGTFKVSGQEFLANEVAPPNTGSNTVQYYLVKKFDKFMCCIIITDTSGVPLEDYLGYFS